MGHPPDERAERLSPEEFRELDRRLRAMRELAYGKVNLCLFLGPVRDDGRHELVTLIESVSLADELEVAVCSGGDDEVICEGVEGDNLVAAGAARASLRRLGRALRCGSR